MISNYKIKKINNEERLLIYIDIDFEFAKLSNKNKSLEKIVLDFIKNNKIYFKGTVISIIVGGVLIGNLILNKPISKDELVYNPDIIEVDKLLKVPDIEITKDIKENEEPKTEINKEIKSNNINISKNKDINIINSEKEINKKDNSSNTDQNNNSNQIIESNQTISQKEEIIDNNTYINIKRRNGNIEKLLLDDYVIGVVGAEMPALFHEEALKAQAVIARTYALKSLAIGKQLTDTESTQSYKSNEELKNSWGNNYNTYYNKIRNCVIATKDLYLSYNGNYIEAVYHSTSNGKTENSKNVWGNTYPYLVSVNSEYDSLNPSFIKEKEFTYQELSNKIGYTIDINTNINIIELTEGDRVSTIQIANKVYKGTELRQILGLRSADFTIDKNENGVKITTKGYGHGVGLSQYGANGMAKNGYNYKEILKHYYPKVTISHK